MVLHGHTCKYMRRISQHNYFQPLRTLSDHILQFSLEIFFVSVPMYISHSALRLANIGFIQSFFSISLLECCNIRLQSCHFPLYILVCISKNWTFFYKIAMSLSTYKINFSVSEMQYYSWFESGFNMVYTFHLVVLLLSLSYLQFFQPLPFLFMYFSCHLLFAETGVVILCNVQHFRFVTLLLCGIFKTCSFIPCDSVVGSKLQSCANLIGAPSPYSYLNLN